jgi:hypothetical protein
MLSEGCCLLARIADYLLSQHMHFTERMLIMPDRANVPTRTAKPAASPPTYDWYDVMSRGSLSSGPPPLISISSSDVAITQLSYYFGCLIELTHPLPQLSLLAMLWCPIPSRWHRMAWLQLECGRPDVGCVSVMHVCSYICRMWMCI